MTDKDDFLAFMESMTDEQRAGGDLFPDTHTGVSFEAGELGGVSVEWTVPDGELVNPDLVVMYIHGGGLVMGSAAVTRTATARIASRLGAKVVGPNYGLAPKFPFPAQQDDVMAVYRGLLDQGYDAARVVVAGDSAGGNLAITLAADARDSGVPTPACLVANSPYADSALNTPSLDDPVKNSHNIKRYIVEALAERYLSSGDVDPMDPRLSPVYRDLGGLPPLLVQAAGFDVCHDDAVRLAASARAAGTPVTLTEYPDSEHIWIVMGSLGMTGDGQSIDLGTEPAAASDAIDEIVAFVRAHVSDMK